MNQEAELDSEFANNVFNNMMDLFFNPEIAKRKEEKLLSENFQMIAAQAIIFPDGRMPLIRFNEDVKAEVKLKKEVNNDKNNFWPSQNEVNTIKLVEKDFMNCGHITIILLNDGYKLSFDFQYNKQTSLEHLKVAQEFLNTARFALDNKLFYSFIDNAFSTVELLAKTNLLIEAHPKTNVKTHKSIQTAFNLRFKNSQTLFEIERRKALNRLSEKRTNARYLEGNVIFEHEELINIYKTIENMLLDLSNRVDFNVG